MTDSDGLTDDEVGDRSGRRRSTSRFDTVADRPHAVPRRDRQDDAVRLRHAGRLQPHHRGSQPDAPGRATLHVRLVVGRRRAARTRSSCRPPRRPTRRRTAPSPPATPSFVQVAQRDAADAADDGRDRRFASAQTAGNLNVVAVGWNNATSNVTSVTDSAGQHLPARGADRRAAAGISQAIYYAKNIAGAAAGANTVTVTFNAAAPYVDVRIAEYTGLDQADPLDVTASAAGTSATAEQRHRHDDRRATTARSAPARRPASSRSPAAASRRASSRRSMRTSRGPVRHCRGHVQRGSHAERILRLADAAGDVQGGWLAVGPTDLLRDAAARPRAAERACVAGGGCYRRSPFQVPARPTTRSHRSGRGTPVGCTQHTTTAYPRRLYAARPVHAPHVPSVSRSGSADGT